MRGLQPRGYIAEGFQLFHVVVEACSVVTKALVPETEAPGFEAKTEADVAASKTEAVIIITSASVELTQTRHSHSK